MHEPLLLLSGFGSFFRLRHDFILNTIFAVLYSSKVEVTCLPWLGCTGRADEDDLVVGLGSGTIHITGLVKHSFVRQQFDRQAFFGVSVQRLFV